MDVVFWCLCATEQNSSDETKMGRLMSEKTIRQEIGLVNRRTLAISGVSQVERFDSEQFLLETSEGLLLIKGENLHLKQLDLESGEVAIEGKIMSLAYLDEGVGKSSKGFFGKLFR